MKVEPIKVHYFISFKFQEVTFEKERKHIKQWDHDIAENGKFGSPKLQTKKFYYHSYVIG